MKNYDAAVSIRQRFRTGAAPAAALILLISGCGSDEPQTTAPTTTVPAATADTTSTSTSSSSMVASSTTPGSAATDTDTVPVPGEQGSGSTLLPGDQTPSGGADPVASPDQLADGTYFGYVMAIGIGDRTITIDIAELLTGDAAVKAAIEDGALEAGETSIDNDYYVRNKNPKLRTIHVGPTAPVNVLSSSGGSDLHAGSLVQLAEALTNVGGDDGPRLPVQIVIATGTVTRIDEVYLP